MHDILLFEGLYFAKSSLNTKILYFVERIEVFLRKNGVLEHFKRHFK